MIWVAIDTPDRARADAIALAVKDDAAGLKVGLEYFCAHGPEGMRAVTAHGLPLFLDLKLHDIPNTVAHAIASLAPLAPAILTVHASGGRAMMAAARDAAPPATKVVGVTVLTSLGDGDLTGVGDGASAQVARLADEARAAGLDGIVCSGAEVAARAAMWSDGFFVVPGLRLPDGDAGDQKRVVSPAAAKRSGASALVIGRPITGAPDMRAAIRQIAATL